MVFNGCMPRRFNSDKQECFLDIEKNCTGKIQCNKESSYDKIASFIQPHFYWEHWAQWGNTPWRVY